MRLYKRKKIFLDLRRKKYCLVRLYVNKQTMQSDYKKHLDAAGAKYHNPHKTLGAHHAYTQSIKSKNGKWVYTNETGIVFLNMDYTGAGIVSHEFAHAILWAWRHTPRKQAYPIIINNNREEEDVLHNLTFAVRQFYIWYWKVEGELKKMAKKL